MRTPKPSTGTKKIACADMLGVTELPLKEVRYYHYERENSKMKCKNLFTLYETPYGISVGCYDVDLARNIMSQISTDPPILSELNRQRFRLLLEKAIRVDFFYYVRFLCADKLSFRKARPPEGYCVKRLSPDELADVPVPDDWLTYGIIINGEVVSRASILEFTDLPYPIRHFQENNPSSCGLDLAIQTERVDDFIFCNTLSDIGNVYTVPEYRRRGFAKVVVSACTADVLARGRILTYNAEVENVASLRTCMSLGYHPYGESLEVLGHII